MLCQRSQYDDSDSFYCEVSDCLFCRLKDPVVEQTHDADLSWFRFRLTTPSSTQTPSLRKKYTAK